MTLFPHLAVIAIGRNEGDRLQRCLQSCVGQVAQVVYVDSGSTDGSVSFACRLGVEVVELDLTIPFTAARARNAGVERLLSLDGASQLQYVQFVDGDCEIVAGWLAIAQETLQQQPAVAVVCGRRRERSPQASIYNLLCDLEWNTPIGEAKACGGDALIRLSAFQSVAGYNPHLIAGEEPELCVRLRQKGWKILRIDAEMTLHDAAITHWSQWWKRNQRAGHAFAEGAWMHGAPPECHWVKETRSNWLWGMILPSSLVGLAFVSNSWGLLLFLLYPLQVYRIYRQQKQTLPDRQAWLYALFCILSKLPQSQGQILFHWRRIRGKRQALMEYKMPAGV